MQPPFLIKTQQTRYKGEIPQLDKKNLQKKPPTANILNGDKLDYCKISNKARMDLLTTLFNIVLKVPANTVRQVKKINVYQFGRKI